VTDNRDILAWLDAAISLREAAAKDAARSYGPRWVRPVDSDMVRVSEDDIWFQALSDEIAEHIVYNSPEVVLRRCAADRKTLSYYRSLKSIAETPDEEQKTRQRWKDGRASAGEMIDALNAGALREHALQSLEALEPVIRNLAEGYGWTEGGQ